MKVKKVKTTVTDNTEVKYTRLVGRPATQWYYTGV